MNGKIKRTVVAYKFSNTATAEKPDTESTRLPELILWKKSEPHNAPASLRNTLNDIRRIIAVQE